MMQVFGSIAEIPASLGRSVIAIGNFDGVHRGHLSILRDVCARARARGAAAVAVTFDPHPLRVLRPEFAPKLITPLAQRLQLLAATGLDAAVVLPFTRAFSEYSAEAFASEVLARALGAVEVHEGDNFRFGYQAQAGMAELRELGLRLGFEAFTHPVLTVRGLSVASSQVRSLIADGAVSQARALLGRPFSIVSTQARGRGIGTRLLVPTVNLAAYDELVPGHGVYITRLRVGSSDENSPCYDAVTNAGNRPTFGEDSYAIESYLLNFDPASAPEITPETPLELSFLARLRGEQRFPSPEVLKAQIMRDVAKAQRYFQLVRTLSPPGVGRR
jgi:riboflavin kinase/FMN adenylyltransferase